MPHQFRKKLDRKELMCLIWSALQTPEICELLLDADPEPECFGEINEDLWHIWDTCRWFHQRYKRIPNVRELQIHLNAIVENRENNIEESVVEEIEWFMGEFSDMGVDDFIGIDVATEYIRRLLSDYAWRTAQEIARTAGKTPQNIAEALQPIIAKADMAASIGADDQMLSFPSGYEESHIIRKAVPYGIEFIDRYLEGGGAPGEIYCLLGSFGSIKTTLLQQLSLSIAQAQLVEWEMSNRRSSLGVTYFVSYELTREVMQYRALANVANIPFNVLMNHLPLSTSSVLNERDRKMFKEQLERNWFVPGEQERKRTAEQRLNLSWRLMDLSGQGPASMNVGGGKVEEIRNKIDADIRKAASRGHNIHVAGIFIDYLGMMMKRHCSVYGLDQSQHLRLLLAGSIDEIRRQLAYRFQCPVFIAQQVNKVGNELRPGIIPKMTMAAECNTVPENCDFVFCASKSTPEKLIRLECQKSRRAAPLTPVVLQIRGEFARVIDVTATWSFDDATKQFLSKT